ncbi:MAG: DUF2795 domain-containing protein [Carbonactinosporaceae bacterium]
MAAATRIEIAEHVSTIFHQGPASRTELLQAAQDTGARAEVVAVLERLPARDYPVLRALWTELSDVPVELA